MTRCPTIGPVGVCLLDLPRDPSQQKFDTYYAESVSKNPKLSEDKHREYAMRKVWDDAGGPSTGEPPPKGTKSL